MGANLGDPLSVILQQARLWPPIPRRGCPDCGARIYRDATRTYCSYCRRIIYDLNDPYVGENIVYECGDCQGTGHSLPVEGLGTCRPCEGEGTVRA